jgi:hypothetical protein
MHTSLPSVAVIVAVLLLPIALYGRYRVNKRIKEDEMALKESAHNWEAKHGESLEA